MKAVGLQLPRIQRFARDDASRAFDQFEAGRFDPRAVLIPE